MRRFAVALVLCALASGVAAQAPQAEPQEPTPSAEPQGDPGRDKPPAQPQGASPAPIIVNVVPATRTEAEAQKEERERQEKAHLDRRLVELTGDLAEYTRWLAYATAALFAVTAGLFIFAVRQAHDAKEAGRAARESAEAAKLSAEASVHAERAIMVTTGYHIGVVPGTPDPMVGEDMPAHPLLKYRFANLGRTPAEIVAYCIVQRVFDKLPAEPEYDRVYNMVPGTYILPSASMDMHEIFMLGSKARHDVVQGNAKLMFYGFIRWRDYRGEPHETRFCTRALHHPQPPGKWFSFVLDVGTPEAYTRRT